MAPAREKRRDLHWRIRMLPQELQLAWLDRPYARRAMTATAIKRARKLLRSEIATAASIEQQNPQIDSEARIALHIAIVEENYEKARAAIRLFTCGDAWQEVCCDAIKKLGLLGGPRGISKKSQKALSRCGVYPPGGHDSLMLKCRACGRMTPPQAMGDAGAWAVTGVVAKVLAEKNLVRIDIDRGRLRRNTGVTFLDRQGNVVNAGYVVRTLAKMAIVRYRDDRGRRAPVIGDSAVHVKPQKCYDCCVCKLPDIVQGIDGPREGPAYQLASSNSIMTIYQLDRAERSEVRKHQRLPGDVPLARKAGT
jgi:hypothetical protein